MTREEFWEIIDTAQAAAEFDRARLAGALHEQLEELDADALLAFIRHFHDLRIDAYRQEVFAAAWICGGGASEEDFSDFRDWLITLGREAYEAVLRDPQRLIDHVDAALLRDPFDPEIAQVATDLYAEVTDGAEVPAGTLKAHPSEPAGRPWEPEELARQNTELWQAVNG